jgi:hypothetical protein
MPAVYRPFNGLPASSAVMIYFCAFSSARAASVIQNSGNITPE